MGDLSHEACRLLNASRIAEPPNPEARQRIRTGIATATGVAAVAGAAGSTNAAIAGAVGTSKVAIAAIVAAVLGFGTGALVVHAVESHAPKPVAAAHAQPAPDTVKPSALPEPTAPIEVAEVPPMTSMHLEPAALRAVPPPVEAPAARPGPADDTDLAAELALIRAADDALAMRSAGRALALVDDHAARFPEGQLAQERDSLRVLALCSLGRDDEARAAARAFFAHWPGSPHAARLRASCAADSLTEPASAGHSR